MFLGLLGEISDHAFLAPRFFGGLDDRILEQPGGLVGDARLAPWTGFATADLIEALGVFPCLFFDAGHLKPFLLTGPTAWSDWNVSLAACRT
jgi:hypothetical protein